MYVIRVFSFFFLLAVYSQQSYSSPIIACEDELNLKQLYDIKNTLLKSTFIKKDTLPGSNVLKSNKRDIYKNFFETCFTKIDETSLKSLNTKEKYRLFHIAFHVNFYYPSDKLIEIMIAIVNDRKSKGEYFTNLIVKLHEAYVRSRDISSARKLKDSYPTINVTETFPIVDTEVTYNRSALRLNINKKVLERESFEIPQTGFVLIISSPVCSPSNRFISWLNDSSNEELKLALKDRSLFLTPTDSQFYIDKMSLTNQMIAPLEMRYAFDRQEWAEVKLWETPVFYFFSGGKLISQMVGWQSNEDKKKFISHLEKVRIL